MSKISLSPDVAGTGIFTIASPGTNTNRTLTLPDDTGTIVTNSGNQAGSFTTLNTSGQVVFNDAGADVDFRVEGDTDANLLFVDASTDRVGIGTNAPTTTLDIVKEKSGSSAESYNLLRLRLNGTRALNDTIGIRFGATNSANDIGAITCISGADDALYGTLTFSTRNFNTDTLLEAFRVNNRGNLLVGTTSVNFGARIEVVGSTGTVGGFTNTSLTPTNGTLGLWQQATSGDNVWVTFFSDAAGTGRGNIDFNRAATLTRYNTASDATLKNIIGDSDGQRSLEILNSTRIREFAWKHDETQKPQIGVIAQELHETYKGAVSVGGDVERQRDVTEEVEEEYIDEEGNTQTRTVTNVVGQETYTEYRPWGVDKTAFTFHLVAGWQAHEKIIKQQADMIAALEARIAALEGA